MVEQKKPKKAGIPEISEFLKGYFLPTVSVIILVCVLSLATVPTISKIRSTNDEIKSEESKLDSAKKFKANTENIVSLTSTYEADNASVDQYLPKQSRVADLISSVNELAAGAGLKKEDLAGEETVIKEKETATTADTDEAAAESEKDVDKPKRVLIVFNYKGTFDQVYKLFEEINNYKQLLSVKSVEFSKEPTTWLVKITVASYNLSDESLIALVDKILNIEDLKPLPNVDTESLNMIKEKL